MRTKAPIGDAEEMVWCTVSQTVNLGNYENFKIEMGTSLVVGKDDPSKLRLELCEKLKDEVMDLAEEARSDVFRAKGRARRD